MPENKHLRFLLQLLYVALALLSLWVLLHLLLPWFLPFLLGALLATMLEPVLFFLTTRMRLPRPLSAGLCTLALAVLLLALLVLLLSRGWYEAKLLLGQLPELLSGLPSFGYAIEDWMYPFVVALPIQFQAFVQETLDNMISQGIALPTRFYDWLSQGVVDMVTGLPSTLLLLFTTFLATYFTSASRPTLISLWNHILPQRWHATFTHCLVQGKLALLGWLKAQGLLMLITFVQLALGFLLLRVELAFLLAALVALVDALPVLGVGTVLFPWAGVSFLTGDTSLTIALLVLYGTILLVRNLLEPRLVGETLGLHPLGALAAMYLGFQLFGVLGMIFSPIVTVLARDLFLRLYHQHNR